MLDEGTLAGLPGAVEQDHGTIGEGGAYVGEYEALNHALNIATWWLKINH